MSSYAVDHANTPRRPPFPDLMLESAKFNQLWLQITWIYFHPEIFRRSPVPELTEDHEVEASKKAGAALVIAAVPNT